MLVQFVGGIGDALLSIFQSDNYTFLEHLKPEERIHVDFVMGNPKLHELVEWHPKRSQLIVSSHDLEFPIDAALLRKWGLPTDHRKYASHDVHPAKEIRDRVRWYPRPEDGPALEKVAFVRPYVVFACSAGHITRNIPMGICREAARVCGDLGLGVVQLGRTYSLTSPLMACVREEPPLGPGVPHLNLVDRLSVPGSLEVVDHARAVFTCHSSMLIEAWFRRIPAYLLYPECMDPYIDKPDRFNFGFKYPEFARQAIQRWDAAAFKTWLRRLA